MQMNTQKSIKNKIIIFASTLMLCAFSGITFLVVQSHIKASKQSIALIQAEFRKGLISKGEVVTLTGANVIAVFVEDNAFFSIQEMITDVVNDDKDIIFGLYMDIDRNPWGIHSDTEPKLYSSSSQNGGSLDDSRSIAISNSASLEIAEYTIPNTHSEHELPIFEFSSPVLFEDEIVGHVRFGVSQTSIEAAAQLESLRADRALKDTLMQILSVSTLAMLLMLLLLRSVMSKIIKPLIHLSTVASKISTGDYDYPIDVVTNDEIGLVARDLEAMRINIRTRLNDLIMINQLSDRLAEIDSEIKIFPEINATLENRFDLANSLFIKFDPVNISEITNFDADIIFKNQDSSLLQIRAEGSISSEAKIVICSIWFEKTFNKSIAKPLTPKTMQTSFHKKFMFESHFFHDEKQTLLYVPFLDGPMMVGFGLLRMARPIEHIGVFDVDFSTAISDQLMLSINRVRTHALMKRYNAELEQKVKERTQALVEKSQDITNMLQNMELGLLSLTESLCIHPEYSAYLTQILETEKISGKSIDEVLFNCSDLNSETKDTAMSALLSIIGEEGYIYELNASFLPTSFSITTVQGTKKSIELTWNPIVVDGETDKLMITIRDITELLVLKEASDKQKVELEIIGELLQLEPHRFLEFSNDALERLNRVERLFSDSERAGFDPAVIHALQREFHTIKGNARALRLHHLSSELHEIESKSTHLLSKHLDNSIEDQGAYEQYSCFHREAIKEVFYYKDIANQQLNYDALISAKRSDSTLNLESLLAPLAQQVQNYQLGLATEIVCIDEAKKLVCQTNFLSIDILIQSALDSLESIAEQLGKPTPQVVLKNTANLKISKKQKQLLNGVFNHLLRNALDHSLEKKDCRKKLGKHHEGCIYIEAMRHENGFKVEVKDDGQGLNLQLLKDKFLSNYPNEPDPSFRQLVEMLFLPGISLAKSVTDISGRGVGLDAVRADLMTVGAQIKIEPATSSTGLQQLDYCDANGHYQSVIFSIILPYDMGLWM